MHMWSKSVSAQPPAGAAGTVAVKEETPESKARSFQCAACGYLFRAVGGAAYKCPGCQAVIDVPPTTDAGKKLAEKPLLNPTMARITAQQQAGVERVQGHPWVSHLRSVAEWNWALPAPGGCDEHLCILMIGGVNMVGRTLDCPAVIRKPLSGPAWHCDSGGRMAKGCAEPMHPPDGQGTGIGPGRSFARRVMRNLPRHGIMMIPSACGHGDMSINAWNRDSVLYSIAIARGRTCSQAVGGRVAGVCIHIGEQDACTKEDADAFEGKVSELCKNIRMDLEDPELPIVLGEIGESFLGPTSLLPDAHKYARQINQSLKKIGMQPNTETVLAAATCHTDKLTFDSPGMEEMGCRYAEAWERLWTKKAMMEVRTGPDGMPYTKEGWFRKFGTMVVSRPPSIKETDPLAANYIWASSKLYQTEVQKVEPRERRRRRRDGEDGERKRRRRDENGEDGGRRRRRRQEQEEGDDVGMKEKLMKIVMGGLSVAAAQGQGGEESKGEAPGDKEEDEKLRMDAGFDDRTATPCISAGCKSKLQQIPAVLVEEHGGTMTRCDAGECGKEVLVLRGSHSGWLVCMACDKGFCPDCVRKEDIESKMVATRDDASDREPSPQARLPDNEA